jgi:hypothetical protein
MMLCELNKFWSCTYCSCINAIYQFKVTLCKVPNYGIQFYFLEILLRRFVDLKLWFLEYRLDEGLFL